MSKPKTPAKTTAVLGWFATTPATEREVIDMANARQVALRDRLRHHYWLTDCRPITDVTLDVLRRKMVLIDPQDELPDAQVEELLSLHFGFDKTDTGWCIPDLDEARQTAVGSIEEGRLRASAAGKASAAKRAGSADQQVAAVPPVIATVASDESDF